jgi:hypothetical protein
MIKSQRAQILTDFLGSLPESIAVRLAQAIELDKLADGKSLPHELILNGLRPVLKKAETSERTPTPMRLFCMPFQDLLTAAPRTEKLIGKIAYSSISTVWNWLQDSVLPADMVEYCAGVKADVLGYRLDNANLRAQEFWKTTSQAMLEALSTDAGQKAARTVLGGDIVLADAREMANLLAIGPRVMEIQRKIPTATPALTEDLLWSLRTIYDSVIETNPDSAPYVAVITLHRLAKPWEALRLPLAISRQTQDTLISNTDMGLVGEILFAEFETHAVAIRAARQPQFDVDELLTHIMGFATLSSGMVKEVEMRRDGKWGQRLLKDRAALAEVMNGFMKRAPKEILAGLPTLKTGSYSGGPRAPDISRAPDAEKTDRALRYAKLIAGCRGFAAAASFGASLADAQDEVNTALRTYAEDMLRELRSAEGERRNNAEHFFALATELTTLLLSPEEGEFLRRRGRAALGTQAAA